MVKKKQTHIGSICGAVFAAVSVALLLWAGDTWIAMVLFAAGFLALGALRFEPGAAWKKLASVVLPIAAAFLALWLMQWLLGFDFSMIEAPKLIEGLVLAEALILLMILLTGRVTLGVGIGMGLLLLATVDYYVYRFRGTEFLPMDILAVKTAINVAGEYDFTPGTAVVHAWLYLALFVFVSAKLRLGKLQRKTRLARCLPAFAFFAFASGMGLQNVTPEFYHMNGTILNGLLANFTAEVRDSFPSAPKDYDVEVLEAYAANVTPRGRTRGPTIIAIMNESFADFRELGPYFDTDEPVTPFLDSLQEDVIRGYALSSVYGGGTANSEYEFLTGNSMGFFPKGSIPYQQYVNENTYSIVSELKSRGYECVAMHPFYSSGWMRSTVYPKLGFDRLYFLEDFPCEDTLRSFVSDREMYEKVIDLYEQQDPAHPMFLFGVTMQNHGGYTYDGADFTTEVHLEGLSEPYSDAEQYLTLIHESDQALEMLIEYFSDVDDPVVIVFFGDHLPFLNDDFYTEIHGGTFSGEDLDEWEQQFEVPFFVWANYNIPEREVPCTSLCYLSCYLYSAARIQPSAYSLMLSEISDVIPALNSYGYYSENTGGFLPFDQAQGEELEALDYYRQLQYNNTFDKRNRLSIFEQADAG